MMDKLFPPKKSKYVWRVVVSAVCWSIWLARNQKIFHSKPPKKENILAAAKNQSKEWCIAFNLITEEAGIWWTSNPIGSITYSETSQRNALMNVNFKFISFIDGSWKASRNHVHAGIGGLLFNHSGEAIFSFSGPILAANPAETEWGALKFLLEAIKNKSWKAFSILIYTDCKYLLSKLAEILVDSNEESDMWRSIIRSYGIQIKLIPSDLNMLADHLAKRGAHYAQMDLFWAK